MSEKKKKSLTRRIYDIAFFAVLLAVLLVPNARAFVQQALMKFGLFKPKLEQVEPETIRSREEAQYQMTFVRPDGMPYDLEDLKGKVVFINFWATWCPPCIAEMPTIQTLYNQFKDDPEVEFVILEVEGNQEKARKFMEKRDLHLPLAFPASNFPKEFYNGTLPTTVILDKKGNIAHITKGLANYEDTRMVKFLQDLKKVEGPVKMPYLPEIAVDSLQSSPKSDSL